MAETLSIFGQPNETASTGMRKPLGFESRSPCTLNKNYTTRLIVYSFFPMIVSMATKWVRIATDALSKESEKVTVYDRVLSDSIRASLTYSTADGDQQLSHSFGIIHHDGLYCSIQHFYLLRSLFFLILQYVLRDREREELNLIRFAFPDHSKWIVLKFKESLGFMLWFWMKFCIIAILRFSMSCFLPAVEKKSNLCKGKYDYNWLRKTIKTSMHIELRDKTNSKSVFKL